MLCGSNLHNAQITHKLEWKSESLFVLFNVLVYRSTELQQNEIFEKMYKSIRLLLTNNKFC